MNNSNQFQQLEDLLRLKSFNELNDNESAFVLNHLSALEYQEQRNILMATAELKTEDIPAPPAIEDLLTKLPKTTASKSRFTGDIFMELLNFRIPVWQIGLGCLIAGYCFFQLVKSNSYELNQQSPYVQMGDTLYNEVILPLSDAPRQGAFAISTKMADSNYNLYLSYLKANEPAAIYFEKPLKLSPIEFKEKSRSAIWRDSQKVNRTDSL